MSDSTAASVFADLIKEIKAENENEEVTLLKKGIKAWLTRKQQAKKTLDSYIKDYQKQIVLLRLSVSFELKHGGTLTSASFFVSNQKIMVTPGQLNEEAVLITSSRIDEDDDIELKCEGFPLTFYFSLDHCPEAPEIGAVLVVRETDQPIPGYPHINYHKIVR